MHKLSVRSKNVQGAQLNLNFTGKHVFRRDPFARTIHLAKVGGTFHMSHQSDAHPQTVIPGA